MQVQVWYHKNAKEIHFKIAKLHPKLTKDTFHEPKKKDHYCNSIHYKRKDGVNKSCRRFNVEEMQACCLQRSRGSLSDFYVTSVE